MTKFPHQTSLRHDHLPIAPSEAHPDNGIQLTLRDPLREMRKRSYVKTRNRQRVRFASLQPYDRHGPDYFLSRRSFDILVEHAQLSEYILPRVLLPPPPRQARSAHRAESSTSHYGRQQQQQSEAQPLLDAAWLRELMRLYERKQQQSETQPLLDAARQRELMRLYGRQRSSSATPVTILPTSHRPVRSSYDYGRSERPSEPINWQKVWTCVKVILWICVLLGSSYGIYRAGVWVVQLVARLWMRISDTYMWLGVKISSLWLAFHKSLGLA